MGTGKRALLYVLRKRGRTLILLTMFTVLSALALIGLSLSHAAADSNLELRQTLGSYFRVVALSPSKAVDDELTRQLVQDEHIQAYSGVNSFYLYTPDLELEPGRFAGTGSERAYTPTFLSVTDSRYYDAFLTGRFELVEGQPLTPKDVGRVLISDTVAKRNKLVPGDTITAQVDHRVTGGREEVHGTSYAFEISGLFHVNENENIDNTKTAEMDLPRNYIFMDESSGKQILKTIRGHNTDTYNGGVTLIVDDPKNIDTVLMSLRQDTSIDWDAYALRTNTKSYDEAAAPLNQMERLSFLLLCILVVLGILLLTMLLILWMRERIHEIGVLLSVGISKLNLIGQFLLECLLVAMVAWILSFCTAALTTESVSILLMKGGGQEIHANLGVKELLAVISVGIAVICLAVGISSAVILRRNPREILSAMR